MSLLLIAGLGLLVVGAEGLVRGASSLATQAGISPLVVGLTVVAFGTGAPALVVSIGSSLSGQADVALGNVVGSNVFNVLFILGAAALAAPLAAAAQLVRVDVPLAIVISIGTLLLAVDGAVGRAGPGAGRRVYGLHGVFNRSVSLRIGGGSWLGA